MYRAPPSDIIWWLDSMLLLLQRNWEDCTYTGLFILSWEGIKYRNNPLTLHLSRRQFNIFGLPSERIKCICLKSDQILPTGKGKQKVGTVQWLQNQTHFSWNTGPVAHQLCDLKHILNLNPGFRIPKAKKIVSTLQDERINILFF